MKIQLRTDVLTNNNIAAEYNRNLFNASHTLLINLMSSPGAGKTSILEETIRHLSKQYRIAVIEGDLATQKDADRSDVLVPRLFKSIHMEDATWMPG